MQDTVLVSGGSGYVAERAARDWVAREGGAIEFCTINPSVVLGPVWSTDYSASVTIVKSLLDGSLRGCPDFGFGAVDERDVADLHVRALGAQAGKVPTRNLPDWLVRVVAAFNPLARAVAGELGSVRDQDASHAKAVLGWARRPEEQSILDAARSLIELGLVKA